MNFFQSHFLVDKRFLDAYGSASPKSWKLLASYSFSVNSRNFIFCYNLFGNLDFDRRYFKVTIVFVKYWFLIFNGGHFKNLFLLNHSLVQWFSTYFIWKHTNHQQNFSGTPVRLRKFQNAHANFQYGVAHYIGQYEK